MESLSDDNASHDYTSCCTIATNWTIGAGNLVSSLTVESSLSQFIDDTDDHHDPVDSTSKSPLILYPPSPDSPPCEITITFAQKQEVRQVYVRSTARVYEIYYAPELRSGSEYLCTVRCGIATRDDKVLKTTDVEEAVSAHLRRSTKEIAEEKLGQSGNLTTSDDDWVEVKVLGTLPVVNRNSSLSSDSDTTPGRNSQDLYEATAEITDGSPCMSLMVKLLSLQNKGCVCVDEVYIFADPLDAATSDNQVGLMENPVGSSLMAMLVPAFYQLSKSKGAGQAEDRHNIDTKEKQNSEDIATKATYPVDVGNKMQQVVTLQEAFRTTAAPFQLEIPPKVPDTEGKHSMSSSHIEDVMDQLVSRVAKIEDLFVRFSESMLKPISSIDERLQRVEQQLEVLTKKTENSGLLWGTRISASEFSCSESETNSFYNSASRDVSCVAYEAKRDSSSVVSSIPPDATSVSANLTKLHPNLVVCAPEFSNYDDEEDNHSVEPVKESPMVKQKHAVSIDDALASALAGFVSSTSIQSPKYTQTLAVKAPEFPCEEESNIDNTTLPRVHSEITTDPSTCLSEFVATEHMSHSFSSSSDISMLESDENVMRSLNKKGSAKMDKEVYEQWQHEMEEESDFEGSSIDDAVAPAQHGATRSKSYQMTEDKNFEEVGGGINNISVLEKTDSLEKLSENQTDDGSDATQKGSFSNELISSIEATDQGSKKDIQQNVEFSHTASLVDYETSILEVKFVSEEKLNAKSPLEALLAGMPDLDVEVPSDEESGNEGSRVGEECNLISVGDWGGKVSINDGHILVDMEYYSLRGEPLNVPAGELQYTCSSQEMPTASLI